MKAVIQELMQKRAGVHTEMKKFLDETRAAGMNQEQEEKYTAMEADIEKYTKQITRETKAWELEQEIKTSVTEPAEGMGGEGDDKAKKEKRAELQLQMLRSYLINGVAGLQRPEFRADMTAGALTEGGALVAPQQFVAKLIQRVDDQVFIRGISTVIPMEKSETLGAPYLDSDVDDAEWTPELGTGSDTVMTFGKRELKPNALAKRVKVSNRLLRLSAIPVEELIMQRLSYKFGLAQEKNFLTGDGANKPLGLFTASTDGISTGRDVSTGNTSSAITFDGLIEALYSLKGQYQSKSTWGFHRTTVKNIRKLKDTTNQYLWQPSSVVGVPDTILGRPYFMSENIPSTFTTGLYVGIVGDFSNYWIAEVLGMTVQKLVELYAETNKTGFIGRMELDGMPVLEEAFARVKLA